MSISAERSIDLNADVGEGFGVGRPGDDDALLGLVTSANVACGHAGDPATMRRACAGAAAAGVAVGAQLSYGDLTGPGRGLMDVDPAALTDELLRQLTALDGIARVAGTRVAYVKPHGGALHDAAVTHVGHAQAVIDAVLAHDRRLPVVGLPGSALLREAEAAGMLPVPEGFADRGYTPAGRLVPPTQPGGLVHDPGTVAERAVRLAADGVVVAVDGTALLMPVRSVCVRGDTPGAVETVRAVRAAIEGAGLALRPFAG